MMMVACSRIQSLRVWSACMFVCAHASLPPNPYPWCGQCNIQKLQSHLSIYLSTQLRTQMPASSLSAEQRKSSLRIVVYHHRSARVYCTTKEAGWLQTLRCAALRCLLPPPPSSHRHGRRGAAHARTRTPPTWSAARGQDRETRELLLLPSLRATDSCFQSSKKKGSSPGGRRLGHVPSWSSLAVPSRTRRRRGRRAAQSNPGGPQHACAIHFAGGSSSSSWLGGSRSIDALVVALLSFYLCKSCRGTRHATKRIAPRRVASLSPRGV
jgi:hypothetical protein